jgi:hypothetical protein
VLLAAASAVLLVPRLRPAAAPAPRPVSRRAAIVAVCLLGLVPLVLVGTARPAGSGELAQLAGASSDIRIEDFGLTATPTVSGAVRLAWRARPSSAATVGYRVFRAASADDDCNPLGTGVPDCVVRSKPVADTPGTSAVDRPGPGRWYYRVAQTASWNGNAANADALLLSRPAVVTVP